MNAIDVNSGRFTKSKDKTESPIWFEDADKTPKLCISTTDRACILYGGGTAVYEENSDSQNRAPRLKMS